jgi:hypothetical protein
MSAPTGNFRGQRTQSSTSGYKTIGSSIASGNNNGSFKRIFVGALGNTNGNYDLAFTKTLGIPKNYYNSSSNSHYYQQPSLSGKTRNVVTDQNAKTLTQVYQQATITAINCVPSTYSSLSQLIAPNNNSLQATATNPFFIGNAGIYGGNLNSFNYQIPYVLLLQNSDVLNIIINSQEQTYNFGINPVVINNGCEITLTITNGGTYKINPICSTGNDGLFTTCINTSNLSKYTDLINRFFPAGLYFNLQNCSS